MRPSGVMGSGHEAGRRVGGEVEAAVLVVRALTLCLRVRAVPTRHPLSGLTPQPLPPLTPAVPRSSPIDPSASAPAPRCTPPPLRAAAPLLPSSAGGRVEATGRLLVLRSSPRHRSPRPRQRPVPPMASNFWESSHWSSASHAPPLYSLPAPPAMPLISPSSVFPPAPQLSLAAAPAREAEGEEGGPGSVPLVQSEATGATAGMTTTVAAADRCPSPSPLVSSSLPLRRRRQRPARLLPRTSAASLPLLPPRLHTAALVR